MFMAKTLIMPVFGLALFTWALVAGNYPFNYDKTKAKLTVGEQPKDLAQPSRGPLISKTAPRSLLSSSSVSPPPSGPKPPSPSTCPISRATRPPPGTCSGRKPWASSSS
jgi:hypothetical protein